MRQPDTEGSRLKHLKNKWRFFNTKERTKLRFDQAIEVSGLILFYHLTIPDDNTFYCVPRKETTACNRVKKSATPKHELSNIEIA